MKNLLANGMALAGALLASQALFAQAPLKISVADYRDKVYASWLGQCIGNIYGLPHENQYVDKPGAETFPYGYVDKKRLGEANGCFSDDDTDFEYMYVMAMEKFGPEPRYKDLAKLWTYHVRDRVWIANLAALQMMRYGYTPPYTGLKRNNEDWFQIDPQLINEIWAVTAPGMTRYAAQKSRWGAEITDDDWGTEPTIHYGAMYAAAFFEKDVNKLIDAGNRALPPNSRFVRAVEDMRALYKKYPNDWKAARAEMAQKYYIDEPAPTKTIWNAILNGAAGILALLYGQGDFQKTLDLSCAIGFDADNQAATMSGLLAIVVGSQGIPRDLLYPFPDRDWKEPFNDVYRNVSRYDLPHGSLKDIAARTAALGEKIILAHGGRKVTENGVESYLINPDATFTPPFELPVGPAPVIAAGEPVNHTFLTMAAGRPVTWSAVDALPAGLTLANGVLSGTAKTTGVYPVTIKATSGGVTDQISLPLVVRPKNLAATASEILVPRNSPRPAGEGRGRREQARSPEVMRDGGCVGRESVYRAVMGPDDTGRQQFGYRWAQPQEIATVAFCPGSGQDAAWYQTFAIEYEDANGAWHPVEAFRSSPVFPLAGAHYDKAYGVEYIVTFAPVKGKAIRVGGGPPNTTQRMRSTSMAELRVYGPIPGAEKLP